MARDNSLPPFQSLAETLRGILRRLDAEQHLHVYRLWVEWELVVGPQIARRARPLEFRNGVLLLVAASATWRQELEFLKPELLQRIRSHLEDDRVRDLAVIVGKVSPTALCPTPQPRLAARREVSLEAIDCEKVLQQVKDPLLAESLRRLWNTRERFRLRAASGQAHSSSP